MERHPLILAVMSSKLVQVKHLLPWENKIKVLESTMKICLAFLTIAVSICCSASVPFLQQSCLTDNCKTQVTACTNDVGCRSMLTCAEKCVAEFPSDPTPEKSRVQNCTNTCAYTYGDAAFESFWECAISHQCLKLPAIPNTCRAANATLIKQLSSTALEGSWWTMRGYNPVYDCYPCDRHFGERMGEKMKITSKYEVYLVNNSLAPATSEFIFPATTPGEKIEFEFKILGLPFSETWWLLDAAEDMLYVLVYYCGNFMSTWYHEGGTILSKSATLSETTSIAESFKKAVGLDLSMFCKPSYMNCPQ